MARLKGLNRNLVSNFKEHITSTNEKRNLILSILKSTTTKREAKNYINKYQNQFNDGNSTERSSADLTTRDAQRDIVINRYLNQHNPFINIYDDEKKIQRIPLRLGIFKIRPSSIQRNLWKGIIETFKRLKMLGLSCVVLLDFDELSSNSFKHNEYYIMDQTNKMMNHFENSSYNRPLDTTVSRLLFTKNQESAGYSIDQMEQVLIPLYQDRIPVIQPIVFDSLTGEQGFAKSDEMLKSFCRGLLNTNDLLTIEKVVILDPKGGIPSIERNKSSHIFINLSQEYSDIQAELKKGFLSTRDFTSHFTNIECMHEILTSIFEKVGNDDATGLITTPEIMSINSDELNPIIYNVLADRPIISFSLPSSHSTTPEVSTSIIKKGIDVKVYNSDGSDENFTLSSLFEKGIIDKDKLINLLNDSFKKNLDTSNYFSRIDKNLATIIIVGDYDGASIITWEKSDLMSGKVAYLDKFAIASANQGLPGLADIIFKLILQSQPDEIIWRSRRNNPVNKWYFQRSCGSLCTSSQWKLFFTGSIFNKRISKFNNSKSSTSIDIGKKLDGYMDIIESIPPSFSK
ncbi:Piso0_000741 [Millerozyma farinosa CBS 7064]|uniref:Amino-acid acetyltransferase, mitochondrial n=1 Tax=Pichia sorbitophila (strain ATCC MYA-4447 / BCRC 22081 / CBS 7064 / NBRC 10061 / NRRL Y-12695) TaxID=559304 RepID=G8YRD9_PICSO|nr:Piso0_000741 [Millerozyma farinosa CBS 7064]